MQKNTKRNILVALSVLTLGTCPVALILTPNPYQWILATVIIGLSIGLLIALIINAITPNKIIGQMIEVIKLDATTIMMNGKPVVEIVFNTATAKNLTAQAVGENEFQPRAGFNAHVVGIQNKILVLNRVTKPKEAIK